MITEKMPRDFVLARRAFEAFFGDAPHVPFEDLAHDYQMRWVETVRKVLTEVQRLKRNEPVELDATERAALAELAPKPWLRADTEKPARKRKQADKQPGKRRTWKRVAWKTAPLKKWKDLTTEERRARLREAYERKVNKD